MNSVDNRLKVLKRKLKDRVDVYELLEKQQRRYKKAFAIGSAKQFRGYNFIKFGIY